MTKKIIVTLEHNGRVKLKERIDLRKKVDIKGRR